MGSSMISGKKNIWYFLFLIMFVLLSIGTLKVGSLRLGQLAIMIIFIWIVIGNILNKQLDLKLIIFLWIFPIFFAFISLFSDFQKIKEMTILVKYIIIFPASFYVGSRIITFIGIKGLMTLHQALVMIYGTFAILLSIFPITFLIQRGGIMTSFRGTFAETGWFANAVMLSLLLTLLLRFDFKIRFKSKLFASIFFIFSLSLLLASRNKTIWIGSIFSFLFVSMHFMYTKYILSSLNFNQKRIKKYLKSMKSFNIPLVLLLVFISIIFGYIYNSFLLEDPIITQELIKIKIEEERGLAFSYAIQLLKDSNWLGMYGFGFVEYYFQSLFVTILGLGEGSASIFNSYLDLWVSVGLMGLLYHFLLLKFSFSSKYLTTMILPVYIFVMCNFNPFAGSEYYYLFLGILYSIVREKHIEYTSKK